MQSVIIHFANEDPVLADMEDMPDPSAIYVTCLNPRRRDGKALHYVDAQAVSFLFPWSRITFIELLPVEGAREEIIEFFRD
jgi:hypothetical protein